MKMFEVIRNLVKKIPKGKVATYSQVAELAKIKDARIVGWAIYGNKDPKIPCHRVVKKDGSIAEKYSLGGWRQQKKRLLKEKVKFQSAKKTDLKKHLWQKDI